MNKNFDNSCEYVPGTPGGPWSQEELLAVRAKLWRLYTNDYVYKLGDLFDKFGLPAPLNNQDLAFFPAKVLRLSFHDCIRYEGESIAQCSFMGSTHTIHCVLGTRTGRAAVMAASTGTEWVTGSR